MQTRSTIVAIITLLIVWALEAGAAGAASRNHAGLTEAAVRARWDAAEQTLDRLAPRGDYPHRGCFEAASRRHGVPLALLVAVARGESDFDARAVSPAGCYGVMQIQWPATARYLGFRSKAELFDACRNIDAGARYLRELLDRFEGDTFLALAAYNYGPTRIAREQGNGRVPRGASWYANYIHGHLARMATRLRQGPVPEGGRLYADYIGRQLERVRRADFEEQGRVLVLEYTGLRMALRGQDHLEAMAAGLEFEVLKSKTRFGYDLFLVFEPGKGADTLRRFRALTRITPVGMLAAKEAHHE